MSVEKSGSNVATKNATTIERTSDREVVMTRVFNGPANIVFDAWTKPELMQRWWVPRSSGMKLLSCEIDLRVGGKYCLTFDVGDKHVKFFGTYKVVERPTRLQWTDDEQLPQQDGDAMTTVTFTEKNGKTTLVMHQIYPTKQALDAELSGVSEGMRETFGQLEELLAQLA